ncbi:hypothetical protein D1164_22670 [Mariniphaga sediminis]|uniref:Uncharacterized protein n=1 Tax=Mariniphaga sediminis TaxID=1628158 RepID=A0A399CTH6_9BACT|nr:hypothetical protein D1164_22670 [Mariniphaga sediminis]
MPDKSNPIWHASVYQIFKIREICFSVLIFTIFIHRSLLYNGRSIVRFGFRSALLSAGENDERKSAISGRH